MLLQKHHCRGWIDKNAKQFCIRGNLHQVSRHPLNVLAILPLNQAADQIADNNFLLFLLLHVGSDFILNS
ncbi:hypothetical protein D3C81_1654740 [compost metagenome]